ncbi:hypothetical protein PENTCL1PPCAC_8534 [Pristionchus entomophagus]|uniref:Protein kinase domain-containing protein n=1 Tax=Pristionchus entomophagus TaxID=358040 RepID=A0AAV5STZ4_9BILA|nr:hypothetical protein PENTCL1PPCAC_8534 [Pristionchus entomophagus]
MKSWFKQMIDAVVHGQLVHGHLKPSNILFVAKDHLKLCTRGMKPEQGSGDVNNEATLYMSPEQRPVLPYTSNSDVFSLGLILVELCLVMTPTVRSEIFENYRSGLQCELIQDARTVFSPIEKYF